MKVEPKNLDFMTMYFVSQFEFVKRTYILPSQNFSSTKPTFQIFSNIGYSYIFDALKFVDFKPAQKTHIFSIYFVCFYFNFIIWVVSSITSTIRMGRLKIELFKSTFFIFHVPSVCYVIDESPDKFWILSSPYFLCILHRYLNSTMTLCKSSVQSSGIRIYGELDRFFKLQSCC